MISVWIYIDSRFLPGDKNHLKVFGTREAADLWLAENDPEGVAFEYDVVNGTTAQPGN